MKRVLFFTQDQWAFGSIHHGLIKELYVNDIYSQLLNWANSYSCEEFYLLNDIYDYFVTQPDAVGILINDYKIPRSKIIAIAHGQSDILNLKNRIGLEVLSDIKKYLVVSNILKEKSIEFGSPVIPEIINIGVHFNLFYSNPSNSLKAVGYAGAYEVKNLFGEEIKRGYLVDKAVELSNLAIKKHQFYNYMCMPAYYKEVDSVVMSSIEESVGLPMLEAACAGKLCIGTPVGYFENSSINGGGIQVRLSEDEFLEDTVNTLKYYKSNPQKYRKKCLDIQEYARYNYDWSKVIDQWVELFSGE
jgi:glycosyltransferase involved in cell wall biosynthesis